MSTPEGKVKEWLVTQFMGYYGDLWKYAPPGGMFGQAGMSDRFFLVHGVFVAIEVKRDGKELTPLQRARLVKIQTWGGLGASMIGKDYAKLQAIFKEIDRRAAFNLKYLRPNNAEPSIQTE